MPSTDNDTTPPLIIGLGEALIDAMPDGDRLGGAPLNVAVHARQLSNAAAVVSRVGDDERGRAIADELHRFGIDPRGLQVDDNRPTGVVDVTFSETGEPNYTIVDDVAWDRIEFDARAAALATEARGVCFGTLAQRSATSRTAIGEFISAARDAVVLFDLNLRQSFFDGGLIEASLHAANAAKLNDQELEVVSKLLGIADVNALADRFGLDWVAVTRGARGTVVYTPGEAHEAAPVVVDVSGGNPVGAGDSVSAALLHGVIRDWPWSRTLLLANQIGAFVASRPEACPALSDEVLSLAMD